MILHDFLYNIKSGPAEKKFLDVAVKEGNCRLAVQLFFYWNYQKYFIPEEILCPESFRRTGIFIKRNDEKTDFFKSLKFGDVIFAERIRNKSGNALNFERDNYEDEDEWITKLHTAIFLGNLECSNKLHIWHATSIEGCACTWTVDKFEKYYKPVLAKRFL